MNRLKFLLFALIVLGLWAFHLIKLSPSLSGHAAEAAAGRTEAAALALSQQLSQARGALQSLAFKAAQSPALLPALTPAKAAKPEPLSAEKFGAIQKAVSEAAPESLRGDVVTVVQTEGASFASKGAEAPVTEGVDFAAAAKSGSEGATLNVFGGDYAFHSFPVVVLDPKTSEVKTLGTVAVGLPLKQPDVEPVAKELNLSGLALIQDGKVVAQAGPEKAALNGVGQSLKPDHTDVVTRGSVGAFGPMKLPILTNGDPMGGSAPLLVGSRKAVNGTPYEVVALASVAPMMQPLAQYQQFALLGFAVLLGLSLIFLVLINNGAKEKGKAMVIPERPELAPTARSPVVPAAANGSAAAAEAPEAAGEPSPLAMPELPPAPEASPDDFQFPGSPAAPAPAASAEMPFDSPNMAVPAPAATNPFEDTENQPTRAYESMPPLGSADPFAAAAAGEPPPGMEGEGEFNPEATRVAMIPTELLQQAKKEEPKTAVNPALARANAAATRPNPALSQNPDEAHWQDVFREFVATREKCGEPADGLTYDKFKVKLQKNREQLVAKYNCRTVRFQVYVKEGKAALKATPVKD